MTVREWCAEGYGRMRLRIAKWCSHRGKALDEDIWHYTILKMIEREDAQGGMRDPTAEGIDNYVFMAYRMNERRERLYPRVARTDYVGDDTKWESLPDKDGDLYLEACGLLGCDKVDALIDGVSEGEERENIISYISEYVKGRL